MKTLLPLLTVLGLAGAAYAGCGKTVNSAGELKSYDADAKTIVVKGAKGAIKISASTTVKDKSGKEVELSALVGEDVKVVADGHKNAKEVTGT